MRGACPFILGSPRPLLVHRPAGLRTTATSRERYTLNCEEPGNPLMHRPSRLVRLPWGSCEAYTACKEES